MKVIEILNQGKDARLTMVERPLPLLKPDEILIKVRGSGINRADIFQKQGKYNPPKGSSDVLGLEVSGEVADIGSKVKGYRKGDKVCALLEGGGYAEYVAVNAVQVLPIPKNLDYIRAASLPEALFTVWSNLFYVAKIKKDEILLVHGGASGIGIAAIQIAKAFGIRVFATAGSDKKCEFIKNLGAEKVVNYNKEDFSKIFKDIDVILDIAGGDYIQKNLEIMAYKGRLVCISLLRGSRVEVNFAPMLLKNLSIIGTTLRSKPKQYKSRIAKDLLKKVWPLIESGQFIPVIDSVFPLEMADKAHKIMENNSNIGKIILEI